MLKLLLTLICLFLSFEVKSTNLETLCVSKDEKSFYYLNLNLNDKKGFIIYVFNKQEALYDVIINDFKDGVVKGISIFKESRTGHKTGSPFTFEYDIGNKTFEESNVKGNCT